MDTNKRNLDIISEIQSLLTELAKNMGESSVLTAKNKEHPKVLKFKGPKGGILLLLKDGDLKSPKTLPQVLQKLQQAGFHYTRQVISTALIRLVQNRVLVRVPAQNPEGKEKWAYAERK